MGDSSLLKGGICDVDVGYIKVKRSLLAGKKGLGYESKPDPFNKMNDINK
jgi:hypothetical protein